MVREARVGRPPVEGPRYESGRRKPQNDRGRSIAQWLRHQGARAGLDPRLRSEVMLLVHAGELTERQADTAILVGRIYGQFERFKRRRRTAASPSYIRAFGDPDGAEDPENPGAEPLIVDKVERDPTELEHRVLKATARWQRLQDTIDGALGPAASRARGVLEQLCVENQPVAAALLPGLRAVLNVIGAKFGGAPTGAGGRGKPAIAITANRPRRRPKPGTGRATHERDAFFAVAKQMQPDLTEEAIGEAYERMVETRAISMARQDREGFRRDKARKARRA